MNKPRLLRIVASSGLLPTRSEAERAIREGRVLVDGLPQRNPAYQLNPKKRRVTVDGQEARMPVAKRYFILNKPAGYTCEKNEELTIYVLLMRLELDGTTRSQLSAVGRLDKDTTGIILFTNDGPLAHKLLRPESHVKKTYEVLARGTLSEEAIERLRKGVEIPMDEGSHITLPCIVSGIETRGKDTLLRMTITEGKKRQIRKMIEAVGSSVTSLKRTRFGGLRLGDLAEGSFKEVKREDII